MKISINEYESGTLFIYILNQKDWLDNHSELIPICDIVDKLGHNSNNCEWFELSEIKILDKRNNGEEQ